MAVRDIPIPPSANIAKVSYDDDTMTLIIQYQRQGITYSYAQVPGNVADGFSTSKLRANQYFDMNIRNQFQQQRMS